MVALAVGICEQAGTPAQVLMDSAELPCGKEPTAINARVAKFVHLFTVVYTY